MRCAIFSTRISSAIERLQGGHAVMALPATKENGAIPDRVLAGFDAAEILRITCDLLAIQSHRNAPGHETPTATHIRDLLRKEGIKAELREVRDGRCNVIATLPGRGNGPSLMFNGHTDTVPPGDMPRPFDPHIVDGKLYARGACDMKAGLAAQLYAMIGLKRAGMQLAGDLIFTGVIAEEDGTSLGTLDVIENGPLPDMVVVAEPSDLAVIVAHKGFDYYRVEVEGVPTHSSRPSNGVSAVYHAARILTAIEERLVPGTLKRAHPLLGSAALNVGATLGYARGEAGTVLRQGPGVKPPGAIVPDTCTIYLDRRRIPGETLDLIKREFDVFMDEMRREIPGLKAQAHFTPGCEELPSHPPLDTDPNHPLVRDALRFAHEIAGVPQKPSGVPFWSDAALFNDMKKIPSIVFGPGNIGVAHSDTEHVPVDELLKATKINAALAIALLG
jgi:acetylornithine deacetylase/succinyl-diaminopimelate desuccinylase family protein